MKMCRRCGVEKPTTEFWPRGGKNPHLLQAHCKDCKRVQMREYAAARREEMREKARKQYADRKADPERHARMLAADRAAKRRRRERAKEDPAVAEALREAHRRWWEGVKADPERHAAMLENRRMDYRLRRMKAGQTVRPANGSWVDDSRELVPVGPLQEWLQPIVSLHGAQAVAKQMDVDEARVRVIMAGGGHSHGKWRPITNVSVDFVERTLFALSDTMLWELYPELYEDSACAAA